MFGYMHYIHYIFLFCCVFLSGEYLFSLDPLGMCASVMKKVPAQIFKCMFQVGQTLSNLEEI